MSSQAIGWSKPEINLGAVCLNDHSLTLVLSWGRMERSRLTGRYLAAQLREKAYIWQ